MAIERTIIEKKIEELEKQRDNFVAQSSMEISSYNGAIQVLKQLLSENQALAGTGGNDGGAGTAGTTASSQV